jgi:hypothetical protein
VYDSAGLTDGEIDRLHERLAPQIRIDNGNRSLLSNGLGIGESQSIAAASLAVTSLSTGRFAVDFLNQHIAKKRTTSRGALTRWAAVAAVVLIAGIGVVIADLHGKNADIASYSEQLESMSETVAAARKTVDRISYAGSWTSRKPEFLECIRQLTMAFPEYPTVWATSLALSEQAEGSLVGKAVDKESFYEVLDKIKTNSSFSDVKTMHVREAGGGRGEEEFAVTFKYRGLR